MLVSITGNASQRNYPACTKTEITEFERQNKILEDMLKKAS